MPEDVEDTTSQDNTEKVAVENKEDTGDTGGEDKAKTEDSKEAEVETEDKAPESYELKLSDKSPLAPSDIDRISTFAKEKGLSNEAAQELVDREETAIGKYQNAEREKVEAVRKQWFEDSKADPEIGGDNFKQSQILANRAVDKFGSEALKVLLTDTGFNDHPEVVRYCVNVGKAMSDDRLVGSKTNTIVEIAAKDVLFPTTAQK